MQKKAEVPGIEQHFSALLQLCGKASLILVCSQAASRGRYSCHPMVCLGLISSSQLMSLVAMQDNPLCHRMTGTAVNPCLRAAFLSKRKECKVCGPLCLHRICIGLRCLCSLVHDRRHTTGCVPWSTAECMHSRCSW